MEQLQRENEQLKFALRCQEEFYEKRLQAMEKIMQVKDKFLEVNVQTKGLTADVEVLKNLLKETETSIGILTATLNQRCEEHRLEVEDLNQRIRQIEANLEDSVRCEKRKKVAAVAVAVGAVAAAGWWFFS
jgi:seryl-tRNA synthetase